MGETINPSKYVVGGFSKSDYIKQTIVEDYLGRGWGIVKEILPHDPRVDYKLVTPFGDMYSIYGRADIVPHTEFDLEIIDDERFGQRLDVPVLSRILRSVENISVLECLVDKCRNFKK